MGAAATYQWRRDGVDLGDGSNIVGAATATLSVSGVSGNDAGGYDVVISNAYGCVTSAVAVLTVVDPVIIQAPISRIIPVSSNATFSVAATGTCRRRRENSFLRRFEKGTFRSRSGRIGPSTRIKE